ncbi:MAG: TMEM175 family protein [Gammaproteobacteria bacterium]|jgi:uncharacterized membrane protein
MRTGLSVSKDAIGAFVDAVYAIAVTILALELPSDLENDAELLMIGEIVINYAISFFILFALWVQHRRINLHIDHHGPLGLWLNALILMLVCLIPRATSFVFEYGGNVNFSELEQAVFHSAGWTLADVIDLGFVTIVLAADIGLLALLQLTPRDVRASEAADIYRSKVTISILLILLMAASLFLPYQNRVFLVALPVFLMLEHHIAALLGRIRKHKTAI